MITVTLCDVTRDIPEILGRFRTGHPDIRLTLKQQLGNSDGMAVA